MKKLIRLVLISTIGMLGIFFMSRNALLAHLHSFGCDDESGIAARMSDGDSFEPALLTEWLASDVLKVNLLPAWMGTEGPTGETMQAYAELHELRQDSEALTDEQIKANKHREAKELLIVRLVAREIHLVDAANGWLEQDRAYGQAKTSVINRVYPGHSEIESYCRRVIKELELSARDHPKSYPDALLRAQAELRELQMQGSVLSSY